MQLHDVKETLINHAENCMRLADKMDSDGRELKSSELKLVRLASLPILEESMVMLTSGYISGNKDFTESELERLKSIVMDFI